MPRRCVSQATDGFLPRGGSGFFGRGGWGVFCVGLVDYVSTHLAMEQLFSLSVHRF
jgi:hypothetical protein